MAMDMGAWDGAQAMSGCAQADDPAAAYEAICAGRRDGDPALQSTWALPHHMAPGDAANADGVRNALSRLPQTDGLTNAEAAQRHLEAHMAEDSTRSAWDEFTDVQVRDLAKRELDVRVVPWGKVIQTVHGTEEFARGAFDHVDPSKVLLMGLEHEAHFGLGQGGEPVLTRHPVGKGLSASSEADGQHMTFRVASTQRGDEVLALANEGIVTGVSPEFRQIPGGTLVSQRNGRRHSTHTKADLVGLSTTYRPAYGEQAAVLAVRSQDEGEGQMAEQPQEAAAVAAPFDSAPVIDEVRKAFETLGSRQSDSLDKVLGRLEKIEEQARGSFSVPAAQAEKPKVSLGAWASAAVRIFSGDRISDTEMRTLADIVTTDNVGVVPPTYSSELIGVINPARPFMQSTRQLPMPETGMSLILPRIKTRPTVGLQTSGTGALESEKQELTSTPVEVDTVTFDAVTKGGAGDLSLQLIKRSSPSFLDLYIRLLAEAYAIESEAEAVASVTDLVGDYNGVINGGSLDPENLLLGSAFTGSYSSIRRGPDSIWMSSAAVAAFIDAKGVASNGPLYSQLQANFTAGGGVGGSISGLRAVYVPALDATGVDVLVGPSTGFGWAEDGTYNLQVDVPGKAGRDVALVGMLWFCPLYPAAFTAYTITT